LWKVSLVVSVDRTSTDACVGFNARFSSSYRRRCIFDVDSGTRPFTQFETVRRKRTYVGFVHCGKLPCSGTFAFPGWSLDVFVTKALNRLVQLFGGEGPSVPQRRDNSNVPNKQLGFTFRAGAKLERPRRNHSDAHNAGYLLIGRDSSENALVTPGFVSLGTSSFCAH
jgi:hypothetical protein